MQSDADVNKAMTGRRGPGRLTRWISRSFGAMRDDLEFVESGSLDVLLYCADDLALAARGDLEVDGSLR